jgi:hypothetical protein
VYAERVVHIVDQVGIQETCVVQQDVKHKVPEGFVLDQEWYESHLEELVEKRAVEKKRPVDRRTAAQQHKGKGRVLNKEVSEGSEGAKQES